MLIYGYNPVFEAIRAQPQAIHFVAVARDDQGKLGKLIAEARRNGVPVRHLPAEQLQRMTSGGVHNGVVAQLSETSYADFDEVIGRAETTLVFLLDQVQDPQNLGSILRVADVFGVGLVVVPEHDSVGLTPAAVKASAGASQWVAVAQVKNLARAVESLKEKNFWVYAAEAQGDAIPTIDFSGRVAVVLGSEGKGIRRNVLDHCDRRISVPMTGHVDSLNVATAAAVIAYEVVRQRGLGLGAGG